MLRFGAAVPVLRALVPCATFVLAAILGAACEPPAREPAPPSDAPAPDFSDVPYGEAALQRFDLYLPRPGPERGPAKEPSHAKPAFPVVVFLHGGGFTGGDKRLGDNRRIMEALRSAGIASAFANYRMVPDVHPASAHDAGRVVQHLRAFAADYGLDPRRIAAMGRSAGGVLSAWITYGPDLKQPDADDPVARESSRPAACVLLSALTDFRLLATGVRVPYLGGVAVGRAPRELLADASPLWHVERWRELPPPAFLLYQGRPTEPPLEDPHDATFGMRLQKALLAAGDTRSVFRLGNAGSFDGRIEEAAAWLTDVFADVDQNWK